MLALAAASDVLFADTFDACCLPGTAESALAPFAHDERISIVGPDIVLDPICAEPLILAMHELATNAHKYGALSVPAGHVELSWRISPSDKSKCDIRWIERNGPAVTNPTRSGLEKHLLKAQRGLAAVTISYESEGLICILTVPALRPRESALDELSEPTVAGVGVSQPH